MAPECEHGNDHLGIECGTDNEQAGGGYQRRCQKDPLQLRRDRSTHRNPPRDDRRKENAEKYLQCRNLLDTSSTLIPVQLLLRVRIR